MMSAVRDLRAAMGGLDEDRRTAQGLVCSADCVAFADAALLRGSTCALCAVKCFRDMGPFAFPKFSSPRRAADSFHLASTVF